MRKATLTRFETGPDGTFGDLVTDSGFHCYIVEKPWAQNKPNESCILPGPGDEASYLFEMAPSERFKADLYHGRNIPGRTGILIHGANWARQLLGCLAPGRAIGDVLGLKGVMSSKDALWGLEQDLDLGPFTLTIRWKDGVNA